jgi:transcriptional regulator with XRE-family HTH domain
LHTVTQRELAAALGVSEPLLSHLLNGRRNLTWPRARVWGAKLRINPIRLIDAEPAELKRILYSKRKKLIN